MVRRAVALCLFVTAALLGACSAGTKAYIPVDSPLRTWEPPEADAYLAEPPPSPTPPAAEEKPAPQKAEKQ
jgi:hypothetical protein